MKLFILIARVRVHGVPLSWGSTKLAIPVEARTGNKAAIWRNEWSKVSLDFVEITKEARYFSLDNQQLSLLESWLVRSWCHVNLRVCAPDGSILRFCSFACGLESPLIAPLGLRKFVHENCNRSIDWRPANQLLLLLPLCFIFTITI